jgi:hypothetical protein
MGIPEHPLVSLKRFYTELNKTPMDYDDKISLTEELDRIIRFMDVLEEGR